MIKVLKEEYIEESNEWKITFEKNNKKWVFFVRELAAKEDVLLSLI